MAARSATTGPGKERYEYRVWGKHRKARRKLEQLATSTHPREDIEDCYLIVDDDDWNAKVRGSRLKVKHRLASKKGFERWDRQWPAAADDSPSPFDGLFGELALDRPARGKGHDLSRAVEQLSPDAAARAVFVTKRRQRYKVGAITAEVSRIDVHDGDTRLHSLALQGDNVKDLRKLLKRLGLEDEPNVPMHVALGNETADEDSGD